MSEEVEIKFKIALDEKNTPASISWAADGTDDRRGEQISKSLMISIWDPQKKNTVRFDLWTKEMMRDEMTMFIFQTLLMMADTYAKATGDNTLAGELQDFAKNFGIKSKIIQDTGDNDITPFHLEL